MSAKSTSAGKSRTEPKGRATVPRNARVGRRRFLTPTMEWVLAVIVIAAVLGLLFILFGDVRSTTQSHAPVGSDPIASRSAMVPPAPAFASMLVG